MSRTFRYIQNDDVLKTFKEIKETVLLERPVVIARHGDYSLQLCNFTGKLGLKIINNAKNVVVETRNYDPDNTTEALVSRGVRHACQKMSELSDEEVNSRRLQIWKWFLLDWQKKQTDDTEALINQEFMWNEEADKKEKDVMDLEYFLHNDYLNLGNTLELIDKYLLDEHYKEMFKKFAIEDIMEMTSEDTKDKSIEETERRNQEEGHKHHTYQFTVSVEASDKEHARQALMHYLAGDSRIKVQK